MIAPVISPLCHNRSGWYKGFVTLSIVVVLTVAVVVALRSIQSRANESDVAAAPKTVVTVMVVAYQDQYSVLRRFAGQIESEARVDLGFELSGRVTEVLVNEGDRVAAGDVLARLDTEALAPERAALVAELAALQADAELARLALRRNDALTEQGFRSRATLDDARLSLARAEAGKEAVRARIAGVDVRLKKSVLTAPFAARIGASGIDEGQTVMAGQRVLVLFDQGPARARVGLPPELAAKLGIDQQVSVEVGGGTVAARVLHIRPDLDPSTRSRSVILGLPPDADVVLGQTVSLQLSQVIPGSGFWAPLAALQEGQRGSWSVMAIESTPEGDRVRPVAVEVMHTDGTRVYLQGQLPPGARIVQSAPDRVAPGQLVSVQVASPGSES